MLLKTFLKYFLLNYSLEVFLDTLSNNLKVVKFEDLPLDLQNIINLEEIIAFNNKLDGNRNNLRNQIIERQKLIKKVYDFDNNLIEKSIVYDY